MRITLQMLNIANAERWLELQKAAFMPYLIKYEDYSFSPATEGIDRVIARMNNPFIRHYFILADGMIAGGVRILWRENTTCYRLSCIFLLEEVQNAGIGQ